MFIFVLLLIVRRSTENIFSKSASEMMTNTIILHYSMSYYYALYGNVILWK